MQHLLQQNTCIARHIHFKACYTGQVFVLRLVSQTKEIFHLTICLATTLRHKLQEKLPNATAPLKSLVSFNFKTCRRQKPGLSFSLEDVGFLIHSIGGHNFKMSSSSHFHALRNHNFQTLSN